MKTISIVAVLAVTAFVALSLQRKTQDKVGPVKSFDQKKYLGKWYEIARLDHKWEKGLSNVTATYSLKENGEIRVDNKGYDHKKDKWEQSIGRAKPAGEANEGKLKVSFFGPFWSGYNIIALDKDYKYALVAGDKRKYLWLLSREKLMPESVKADYLAKAREAGYDTDKLIWVAHDRD